MKDLDFDELDRAVNSLMKDAPKAEPEPKLTDEQTVTISPTIKNGDKPSLAHLSQAVSDLNGTVAKSNTLVPEPTPMTTPALSPVVEATPIAGSLPKPDAAPVTEPKQAASVASRRGKFMDVVRPGTTKPEPPIHRRSREGIAIDPTRPIVNDVSRPVPSLAPQKETVTEASSLSDVKAESTPIVSSTPATEQMPSADPVKEDWPDPIAMAGYEESALPAKTSEPEQKPDTDTPLVSPFLPDAKVEKRPLGGQSPIALLEEPEPETTKEEDATTSTNGAATAQLPASPVGETPLPEELSGDVVALESDASATLQPTTNEASVAPMQKEEPAPESPATTSVVTSTPSSMPVTQPPSTAAISIPQQYKEEPSTGDKDTGSIYDTDTYHQPLAHPGKKKSGWMWVIWIILILVLGAGAGAALYYFKVF